MPESILQEDNTKCFLCGQNPCDDPLDKHHIFNAFNRDKSEKYGLFVYIHHNKCHIFGKESVHKNAQINNKLKTYAQQKAMEYYGWTVDMFIQIFGKNYLD